MGLMALVLAATGCGGGSGSGGSSSTGEFDGSSTGGERNPVCRVGQSGGEVRRPEFVRNLAGQTSWLASPVVADLDHDGENELIAAYYSLYAFTPSGNLIDRADGNGSRIYAPHVVVDLEGDGTVEIVCGQGRQVYAYEWRNRQFSVKAGWPADTTCAGSAPEVRGLAAADLDGEAIDASPWFTNRSSPYVGNRMTWGQFIRWCDPDVEADHDHLHVGEWPHPEWTEWLQWTASPPHVADLDLDGRSEVIGIPNVEFDVPYVTQAYALMVLEGAHGDGSRSAMRKPGWEVLPRGDFPVEVDGWYPPGGVPAAAIVDIQGDARKEIVVSLNDGFMYCFSADAQMIWRFNYTNGKAIMYASEPMAADLNQDGSPEIVFSTYGDPDVSDSGHLIILGANGTRLHDIALPNPGHNGNGNGAPAAPTLADLDGDGRLEIMVQTFDHGMDVFTIPDSGCDCLLWTTARGGPLRMGQPSGLD